jgi:DNA polymerase III sliding clamp (beta) subunit (PCNA family)
MKITLQQFVLKHLMAKALSVSIRGSSKEDFFEFELDGKVLKVFRADDVLFAVAQTELITIDDASEPTKMNVSTEKLINLVENMDSDRPITLEATDKYGLKLEGGQFSAQWSQINSDVDKTPTTVKPDVSFEVLTSLFIKAIERTKYIVDTEHMQYRMRNVFFEKGTCWTFDNFSYQRVDIDLGNKETLMIPSASLDVVKFLKQSGQEKMVIEYNARYMVFKTGEDIFACKRENVEEPPFVELLKKLDKKAQGRFHVDVSKLTQSLKRIGVTAESGSMRVSLEVGTKKLVLSSEDDKANVSHDEIDILFSGNTKMKKKFDIRWSLLVAALNSVMDKTILLGIDKGHVVIESKDSFGVVPMVRRKENVRTEKETTTS